MRATNAAPDGLGCIINHMVMANRFDPQYGFGEMAYILQRGPMTPGLHADRLIGFADGSMAVIAVLPDGADDADVDRALDALDATDGDLVWKLSPDGSPRHESIKHFVFSPGVINMGHVTQCNERGAFYYCLNYSHEDGAAGRWLES